jgi:hypothetical protein
LFLVSLITLTNLQAALTVQANLEKATKLFERAVKEISLLRPPTEAERCGLSLVASAGRTSMLNPALGQPCSACRRVNEVIKSACVLFSQDFITPFRVMKKVHTQPANRLSIGCEPALNRPLYLLYRG